MIKMQESYSYRADYSKPGYLVWRDEMGFSVQ